MTKSKRYHTTGDGAIHEGTTSSCSRCKRKRKQDATKEKKKPEQSPEGLIICKVPGCKNTLGPTNTSGYCRTCFLRSDAWKNTQKKSLCRVKEVDPE